jgi:DNA-binding HxlR family transcriptional regulator
VTESAPVGDAFDERYPARRFLNLIGDKWTPIVMYCISGRTRRFNELHANIPGVSKKMLVQVLRRLEHDGLVHRTIYPVVPPRTEYRLTPLGERIHEPIAMLCQWAIDHEAELLEIEARRNVSRKGTEDDPAPD